MGSAWRVWRLSSREGGGGRGRLPTLDACWCSSPRARLQVRASRCSRRRRRQRSRSRRCAQAAKPLPDPCRLTLGAAQDRHLVVEPLVPALELQGGGGDGPGLHLVAPRLQGAQEAAVALLHGRIIQQRQQALPGGRHCPRAQRREGAGRQEAPQACHRAAGNGDRSGKRPWASLAKWEVPGGDGLPLRFLIVVQVS